jgi:hypothetical protein
MAIPDRPWPGVLNKAGVAIATYRAQVVFTRAGNDNLGLRYPVVKAPCTCPGETLHVKGRACALHAAMMGALFDA